MVMYVKLNELFETLFMLQVLNKQGLGVSEWTVVVSEDRRP